MAVSSMTGPAALNRLESVEKEYPCRLDSVFGETFERQLNPPPILALLRLRSTELDILFQKTQKARQLPLKICLTKFIAPVPLRR
jgi:hypothetical protein